MNWENFSRGKNVDSVELHQQYLTGGDEDLDEQEKEVQEMFPNYTVSPYFLGRAENDILKQNVITYATKHYSVPRVGVPIGFGSNESINGFNGLQSTHDGNHKRLYIQRSQGMPDVMRIFEDEDSPFSVMHQGSGLYVFQLHEKPKRKASQEVIDLTGEDEEDGSERGSGGGHKKRRIDPTASEIIDLRHLSGGNNGWDDELQEMKNRYYNYMVEPYFESNTLYDITEKTIITYATLQMPPRQGRVLGFGANYSPNYFQDAYDDNHTWLFIRRTGNLVPDFFSADEYSGPGIVFKSGSNYLFQLRKKIKKKNPEVIDLTGEDSAGGHKKRKIDTIDLTHL